MTRPKVQIQTTKKKKQLYKVAVLFKDYSQEANLRKLNLGDDVYQLVGDGRRRIFIFLFKYEGEANFFSDMYYQASMSALTSSDAVPSGSNSNASDEDDNDDDIFEASQDVYKIVGDHAKKRIKDTPNKIQSTIKEEDE